MGEGPIGRETYGKRDPWEKVLLGEGPMGGRMNYGERPMGEGSIWRETYGRRSYGEERPMGEGPMGESPMGRETYGRRSYGRGTHVRMSYGERDLLENELWG